LTTFDTSLRPAKHESGERRDPREVFREFIACLSRAARGRDKIEKESSRRGRKRRP